MNISKATRAVVSFPSLVVLGAVISGCAGGAALQNPLPSEPRLLAAQAVPSPYVATASVARSVSADASSTVVASTAVAPSSQVAVDTLNSRKNVAASVLRNVAVSLFTPLPGSRASTVLVAPTLVPSAAAVAFASTFLGAIP